MWVATDAAGFPRPLLTRVQEDTTADTGPSHYSHQLADGGPGRRDSAAREPTICQQGLAGDSDAAGTEGGAFRCAFVLSHKDMCLW